MIRPRLLDEYRTRDAALLGRGAAVTDRAGPVPRLVVRTDEALLVHDLAAGGSVEPVAVFPGRVRGRPIVGQGPVAPDLSHAVLVDEHSYRVVTPDGTLVREHAAAGPHESPVRYARWVQPPGAQPRLWLAVPCDPATDGVGPREGFCLLSSSATGDELDRLVVPAGGHGRSVRLALGPDGRPVAVGVRASARATTFRVGPGGTVSPAADRELLDTDPAGSGFVTVGMSDRGDTTDVRWHSARGTDSTTLVTCAGLLASEQAAEPVHINPYLAGSTGGFLDDDTLLLVLEDDYDEAETEIFGREHWRPSSHWATVSGHPRGRIIYPDRHHTDDLAQAVPLGDGTWLTHDRSTLYHWALDR